MSLTSDDPSSGAAPSGDPADPVAAALDPRYQVVRLLGRGATAAVYLARDRELHRVVAVKALRPELRDDPDAAERFREEARLSVQLTHPGIVPVYAYERAAALPYLVMQYVDGGSLADRLGRIGRAPVDETRRVLAELADVLDYAHRKGVIHRDLKPENVLLAASGASYRPLLCDFGVAVRSRSDRGAGRAESGAGTAAYASPEQWWGTADVDRRSDLYSLGVLGYRMLAGVRPYEGATAAAIAARQAAGVRRPLAEAAPQAPRALCAVIERCLAPDPADRWRNAREFREALLAAPGRDRRLPRVLALLAGLVRALRERAAARRGDVPSVPGDVPVPRGGAGDSSWFRRAAGALDGVGRDVRTAVRAHRRAPGLAAAAVVCLVLGIGANAAVFSVLNAVLLRPLPYPEPERLVVVNETLAFGGGFGSVSVPNFRDWAAGSGALDLALHTSASPGLRGGRGAGDAGPARVRAVLGGANLFRVLGVRPLLGRTFLPGEDAPGRGGVAVLSEALWRGRFGADPGVVGRAIVLDGAPRTVVGVMPAAFEFPARAATDVWLPFVPTPDQERMRDSHMLQVVGRLRPGATVERAQAELDRVAAGIRRAHPEEAAGRGARVTPLREVVVRQSRPALLALLGAVALVLLVACANVANLLLARAAARGQEVAVRLALGAGRARLVRQFLTESVLLALAGAVLGGAAGWLGVRALTPLVARALPVGAAVPLDGRVLAFLLAAAVASGLAFGLAPALQASRADVRDHLGDAGGRATAGGRRARVRGALVVGEVALTLVLLAGAGLLLRGFALLRGTATGLATAGVLTAHLTIPAGRYGGLEVAPRLLDPVLERVRAVPGVRAAGVISHLPVQRAYTNGNFTVEGRPRPERGREPLAEWRAVSPGYFGALGVPLRAGRPLGPRDDGTPGRQAVLVNEALARRHFPGASPLGARLRFDDPAHGDQVYTIVGVVGDVRQAGLDVPPLPELYFSHADSAAMRGRDDVTLVVAAAVPPARVAGAVRAAVRGVDPDQPVYAVMTMDEVIEASLAPRRLTLWLFGTFAGVALALASAGVYGVVSYLVAQRRREMGIRLALGARGADVVGLVMRQGARLTALGLALGLAGALALTRLLAGLLYGVPPRDPPTLAAVAALLALVATLAAYVPARRAARADPMLAVRGG